jgi:hypothetical protein
VYAGHVGSRCQLRFLITKVAGCTSDKLTAVKQISCVYFRSPDWRFRLEYNRTPASMIFKNAREADRDSAVTATHDLTKHTLWRNDLSKN